MNRKYNGSEKTQMNVECSVYVKRAPRCHQFQLTTKHKRAGANDMTCRGVTVNNEPNNGPE